MEEVFSNDRVTVMATLGDELKVKNAALFNMVSHPGRVAERMIVRDVRSGAERDIINSLVPEGYRIVLNEYTDGAEPDSRLIAVDFSAKQRGKLLALMHEIGHANIFARLESSGKSHKDLPHHVHERGAWAYALKTHRRFQSEGIEIADGMTPDEVRQIIRGFLVQYEVTTGNHTRVVRGESEFKYCHNPETEDIDRLVSQGSLHNFPDVQEFRKFLARQKK